MVLFFRASGRGKKIAPKKALYKKINIVLDYFKFNKNRHAMSVLLC